MGSEYSSTIAGIVQKLETRDPFPPACPKRRVGQPTYQSD